MQKSVKVLLTAVIAVSMCAAMAGCGESDDKGKTAPISTVSTEESAVSDTESSEEISEEESDENEEFAGTTKEKASALAVKQATDYAGGGGFRAVYAAQKNDDEDMWEIIIIDDENFPLIAFVKGEECSFDTIEEKVFANTTESGAVSTALSNAGDGVWTAEETQMITYPNKKEFWQVT
ncbi:MAG: hypothetical protein IIT39_14060, partial [Clostridia bacterium]|nr:hypothetical protein [Clostridia bacterium]